ncbi:hypothetical protein E5288_WYG006779 [Bos mutus]|uniref:Uncharacterized protein n=1 Tax=Bos mutus TaxID=72004 RepID=A0A6B0REB6_9CETA|nr:hypothetical protein [Bos mutus]
MGANAAALFKIKQSPTSFSEQAHLTGVSIRGPDHRRKKPDGEGIPAVIACPSCKSSIQLFVGIRVWTCDLWVRVHRQL